MKSPMVTNLSYIDDKGRYSELQVLQSGAGWYVGTIYNNPEGFPEPGSRDSGYFATEKEAGDFLKLLEADDPLAMLQLRDHP